jgi:hypothetical protein
MSSATPIQTVTSKISNAKDIVTSQSKKISNGIAEQYKKTENAIGKSNTFTGIKDNLKGVTNSTGKFAENNSGIAKIIFIVFVFVIFGLLFRLGVYILTLFYVPQRNPIVVKGMRSTLRRKNYTVNPNRKKPKPILRSINENQGMEFTWSSWIWVNSANYEEDSISSITPRRLFTKGFSKHNSKFDNTDFDDDTFQSDFIMNSPGLYMYDPDSMTDTNSISVVLSFFDEDTTSHDEKPYEIVTIKNIPIQKWFNVIIRIQGRILDVYINGTLTKHEEFTRVIKQNYGDIRVGDNKFGADAYVSSLRYFDHAIGANAIQDIMYNGPNLKMEGDEMTHTKPPYLAMRWYLDDN